MTMREIKEETRHYTPFHWFALVVVTTWILFLLVGAYWLLYPYQPVTLEQDKMVILNENKEVVSGNNVEFNAKFRKSSNVKPTATYYLVDGVVSELKVATINRPVGDNSLNREIYIPIHTGSGTYHLQIDLEYKVNPLRTLTYSWVSEDFEVINKNDIIEE